MHPNSEDRLKEQAVQLVLVRPATGMGFPDSVEGRIRVDSGGFRAAPQGEILAYCTVCMGILTLQKQKWIPGSDGFGRWSDSGGFGRIPGPHKWNPPTQLQTEKWTSVSPSTRAYDNYVKDGVDPVKHREPAASSQFKAGAYTRSHQSST